MAVCDRPGRRSHFSTPSCITAPLAPQVCRLPIGPMRCWSPSPLPGSPETSSALTQCKPTSPDMGSNVTSPELIHTTTLTYEPESLTSNISEPETLPDCQHVQPKATGARSR